MKNNGLKNAKAITLIALIVTIIVLLILAGISIAALIGNNGVLNNASITSTQYAYKAAEEQVELAYTAVITDIMAKTAQNGTYNPTTDVETVRLAGIVKKDLGITNGDTNGTWSVDSSIPGVIKITYTDSKIDQGVMGEKTITKLGDLAALETVPREEGVVHYQIKLLKEQKAKLYLDVMTDVEPFIDSSYVQYDVAYTDVYTGKEYKASTGWRLLTKIEEDTQHYNAQAGTYTGNIEIISTGIPAGLKYNKDTITSAIWAGTPQQRADYLNTSIMDRTIGGYNYPNRSADNANIYAAAGLLRNFGDIVFSTNVIVNSLSLDDGIGGFVSISNNGTELQASNSPTGENLFKISKTNLASGEVTNIRSVNLWDIKGKNDDSNTTTIDESTDKRMGLFRLDQYTPDPHNSGHYWLASPTGYSGNYGGNDSLCAVLFQGSLNNAYGIGMGGVRPVISITGVKLQKNGNVWQIVE